MVALKTQRSFKSRWPAGMLTRCTPGGAPRHPIEPSTDPLFKSDLAGYLVPSEPLSYSARVKPHACADAE
jgi:hypothetical protein